MEWILWLIDHTTDLCCHLRTTVVCIFHKQLLAMSMSTSETKSKVIVDIASCDVQVEEVVEKVVKTVENVAEQLGVIKPKEAPATPIGRMHALGASEAPESGTCRDTPIPGERLAPNEEGM